MLISVTEITFVRFKTYWEASYWKVALFSAPDYISRSISDESTVFVMIEETKSTGTASKDWLYER
jgi:hypothetical protein